MNILVIAEQRDNTVKKASFEAVRAAAKLAGQLGASVTGMLIGGSAEAAASLGGYGATKVLHVADERLALYSSAAYATAVTTAAAKENADIVILPATSMGKDLAPRLAVRLDGAVVPDVTALDVDSGDVIATRPIYAGKALEKVRVTTAKKVFSLRPNVFTAGQPDGAAATVETLAVDFTDADFATKATGTSIASGKLDVSEATVIVSGGRGLQGPEHWPLIEGLAAALGRVTGGAATGASRAVVDAGWRPHGEQVGQTGKTVSPNLYVACGISGAIQHLAGMSSSKCIVAINKDKDAPIFQVADYGIVGDVFEVIPALTEELGKL
ncbi:MAG: electron transfer flavoprotein subunit alpha/FixB family protein [Bacteroidia bacterium]|nr:electron transfer flavoprotein subunit alpha/FixB family protein [Bacteroidia bacterium]